MIDSFQSHHVALFFSLSRHHHSLAHHLVRGMTWCSVVPGLDVTWMMRMSVSPSLILAQVRGWLQGAGQSPWQFLALSSHVEYDNKSLDYVNNTEG